jgi:hypothetical protein
VAIQVGTSWRTNMARYAVAATWGRIWLYTGTPPATPFLTATGTLLVTVLIPDNTEVWWGSYDATNDASLAYIGTYGWPLEATIAANGVATYYRVGLKGGSTSAFASAGSNVVEQGNVGVLETDDMVLLNTTLVAGQLFTLADFKRSIPLI